MTKAIVAMLFAAALASAQNPLMQAYMPRYNTFKQNLLEAADAMPAEHYSFKLSPAQRAFGEWVEHTVMLMHNSCAAMKGGPAPAMDHSKHSAGNPKPQLQSALKEAADSCDAILKGMTDLQALAPSDPAKPASAPINPMLTMLTNMASHYGNMVGYLRAKGIVPPSTARSQKR